MTQATVIVQEETMKMVKGLAALRNRTVDEVIAQALTDGVKAACYRHKRNAQQWAEKKALKANYDRIVAAATDAGIDIAEIIGQE
jgi:hypothetical protein